jgi:hypothetical protein
MANTGDLGGMALSTSTPPGVSDPADDSDVMGLSDKDVPPEQAARPSTLDDEALFLILQGWWRADSEHSMIWRNEAKEDYDFRAGDQWTAEDRQLLNAQQRPHIVFNRVLTILKAVAGMEINGRHEITYRPVNTQDTAINEVLSAASKWMAEGCDAEDEESAAFEDALTCGMGWCENRIDYEEQWNGKYVEGRMNPLEMYWDRTAEKKNLTDARRLARVRKMPLGDAMQLFPKFERDQLDAAWAVDSQYTANKTLEEKRRREANTTETSYDDTLEVNIVHMQWWEREYYWKIANLQTNSMTQLKDAEYKVFEARMKKLGASDLFKAVRLPCKVYKQAFLGNILLKVEDSPVKNQFTWKCITGELNHSKKLWFGLVRVMRDPQMWSNKWLSQTLHILNATAKGGIIAEEDAFAGDIRDVEDKYARPDTITWAAKGAIAGSKIMEKPGKGITEGHVRLMEYAISSIRDTTGINLELLGQQDQNQPGILEQYRKQAGMTVLATMFDSLRRFRKLTGHIRLYFIQNFLADGRLVRVVGQEGAKALPLLKDKCLGEYDTIVDDTPTSPNMKEQNWAIIQPMLAVFKDQLVANPEVLVTLLEYSPLPSRVVEVLKNFAAQSKNDPDQQQMKQLIIADKVANINKNQSTAEMQDAKAGATQATAAYDVAMARHLLMDKDVDGLGAHLEHLQKAADVEKTMADTEHTRAKMGGERAGTRLTHAQVGKTHAETMATHVGSLVDAMTPIEQPNQNGNGTDTQPTQSAIPPGMPAGAKRARDGNHYIPDPNRPGKYMMVVPQQPQGQSNAA